MSHKIKKIIRLVFLFFTIFVMPACTMVQYRDPVFLSVHLFVLIHGISLNLWMTARAAESIFDFRFTDLVNFRQP